MDQTWLEKAKIYLVEVVLRKIGPATTASFLSLIAGAWAAHQNSLESWGVNYIPDWSAAWLTTHEITGHVILLELDTTSSAAWALIGTLFVGLVLTAGHHTTAAVTGAPQSGGQRATDA